MDDAPLVEVVEPFEDADGDLAEDELARPAASLRSIPELSNDGVERATLAKLHEERERRLALEQERAEVLDDVGVVAGREEGELA